MTQFQKVAILGRGYLGSAVLEELTKAHFEVTVLTRAQSTASAPSDNIAVKEVDYSSASGLEAALKGHDVVVSTVNPAGIALQKVAIDASIAAGVKRFIPADFGLITTDPDAQKLPVQAHVVEIQGYLAEKADAGELEYTIFAVGLFLELFIKTPLAIDLDSRTATLYDRGVHPVSASSVSTIGKAVAAALRKPDETKNSVLRIHDIVLTQRKVLELLKKYSPGDTWTETSVDGSVELETLLQRLRNEGPSPPVISGVFKAAFFSGKYNAAYDNTDNELLGLGFKTEEDVEALAAELLKR
ncbi:NmrA-like family protein [Aspergillus germanicus]